MLKKFNMHDVEVMKYYICNGKRCGGRIGELNGQEVNCIYSDDSEDIITTNNANISRPRFWCKYTVDIQYAKYLIPDEYRMFDVTNYFQDDKQILLEKEYDKTYLLGI